jgi:hypothetical protein
VHYNAGKLQCYANFPIDVGRQFYHSCGNIFPVRLQHITAVEFFGLADQFDEFAGNLAPAVR